MASSINASTSAGVVTTADTSGVLNIQTAGTTAISIDASQAVSFTNAPTVTGGTANGVAYLNGSKVLTTGSSLTWDGTNLTVNTGTVSATYGKLTVAGGISITPDSSSKFQIGRYSAGAPYSYIKMGSTSSGFKFTDPTDSFDLMALNSTGALSLYGASVSANGVGITFPATQSASTDPNTLDDYEEGTYTPTASNFSTTGTVTLTGRYTRIGNSINFSVRFESTGTIGFSTSALITTPFTVKQATGNITMRVASNSASFNGNQSGAQCNTDEAAQARFFVGNFTTTSAGQVLIFAGTFEQH